MSALSHSDIIDQFSDAMRAVVPGLHPRDIVADGEIHRFTVEGDRRKSGNGWYSLHLDGHPSGAFGSWKSGDEGKWSANGEPMSAADKAAFREKMERARARREADDRARREKAADIATSAWNAARHKDVQHGYLGARGIQSCGARIGNFPLIDRETGAITRTIKDALLLQVRDLDKNIHSIQAIAEQRAEDGSIRFQKLFLAGGSKRGHFHAIGQPKRNSDGQYIFVVVEGFSTGASVHQATGHATVCAFDAGNLMHVAKVIRARFPGAVILLAGDDDAFAANGNTGRTKASDAAAAVCGLAVFPVFEPGDLAAEPTDWNDAHALYGLEFVERGINSALYPVEVETEWEPTPEQDTEIATQTMPAEKLPAKLSTLMIGYGQVDGAPIAMGRSGDLCGFYTAAGDVILLRDGRLFSDPGILRLQSLDWWTQYCMGDGSKGKYDPQLIGNALLETTHRAGDLDAGNIPAAVAPPDEVRRKLALALLHSEPSAHTISALLLQESEWRGVIWWNEFAGRVETSDKAPCGGMEGPWTDRHDKLLAAWMMAKHGVTVSRSMVAEAVELIAYADQRHPVRDYLQSLEWDGVPRLDAWLTRIAGAEENEYTRNVGSKTLIGAVARIMEPGCKFDTMLVFEGDQGVKKSSLLSAMSPKRDWFTSSIKGDLESKDVAIGLTGKWVIEMAEMAVTGRNRVEVTKGFMSEQVDNYRAPYGTRSEDHPRQCAFFGTINPDADGRYLHDTTGGRRFWPVVATRTDIPALIACRDQLWAEAVHRYKQGEQWWLSEDVEALAKAEQAARQQGNVWEEHLDRYMTYLPPTSPGYTWGNRRGHGEAAKAVSTSDIFSAIMGRPMTEKDTPSQKGISAALKASGWVQRRSNGGPRTWFPGVADAPLPRALPAPDLSTMPAVTHEMAMREVFG